MASGAQRVVSIASGSAIIGASALVAYDYFTMHPMRKFHGWTFEESAIRLGNEFARPSKIFTMQDLAAFDGKDGSPLYFSANGLVFDASPSEMFREAYGGWAGKDATIALGKMSLAPEDANRTDWDCLSEDERKTLADWMRYFQEKYRVKGSLHEFDGRRE